MVCTIEDTNKKLIEQDDTTTTTTTTTTIGDHLTPRKRQRTSLDILPKSSKTSTIIANNSELLSRSQVTELMKQLTANTQLEITRLHQIIEQNRLEYTQRFNCLELQIQQLEQQLEHHQHQQHHQQQQQQ